MPQKTVYLDYAASAPLRDAAKEALVAYEQSEYAGANPNSLHTMGRKAARALDGARADIARALGNGFRPADIVFTSGGTESNNLAVLGIAHGARARDRRRERVIISAIEHDSVLDLASVLRGAGFSVDMARPGADGKVTAATLQELLGPDVAVVSVMSANNETGVIQPVADLARAAKAAGAFFHTDAVQAFGRVEVDLSGADAVSIAAHKIGGPVGIGALAIRGRTPLHPMFFGGGQQAGKRPGTEDVRGALAFAAAAAWCAKNVSSTRTATAQRAQALYQELCAPDTGIVPTVSTTVGQDRLPGIVSVMVPGLDSETMILELDQLGFEVSAGSACSSGSLDPSHVLSAMGIPRTSALGSLRISFDERVSEQDLGEFAQALLGIVSKHKKTPRQTR